MTKTKIEWADRVWNTITGCSKVSAGCDNCYAEKLTERLQSMCALKYKQGFNVVVCHDRLLNQPNNWKKPTTVFVNSMSDTFHEKVPFEFIDSMFNVMVNNPQHRFLLLTKRPDRALEYIDRHSPKGMPRHAPNIWIGVTAEDQTAADIRIPTLLKMPAAVRFVSVEPMIGPVNIEAYKLDLVICGCESGPKARPAKIDWIRSLRDQCVESGTPLFLKQMVVNGKITKMPELDGVVWDQIPSRTKSQV